MKKLLILSIAGAGFLLTSCGKNSYPTTTSQYPYPRTQSPYPRSEPVIVDRDGRVITKDGRVVGNAGNLPPGQAKKIYGSKSAKIYAPGQRKKQGNVYNRFPPSVIRVDDRYAKRDNSGRAYYLDKNGYVFWRGNDGYYHLDNKYSNSEVNNDRHGNGKNKR